MANHGSSTLVSFNYLGSRWLLLWHKLDSMVNTKVNT